MPWPRAHRNGCGTAEAARKTGPRTLSGLVISAGLVLVACVGPARTDQAYRGKAVATAEAMIAAVETGRLTASQASGGRLWATTASVILADTESDASSLEGQFGSMQPPGPQSDRIREQLAPLLGRASAILQDLRITVRRGELDRLAILARPLIRVSRDLRSFVQANGPPE